jgi:1,2-diacylglycerol 3-alpha-glucosyltransferase
MMVDTYKPYISGITNYIELNKRYLELAGHEVYVFTFGNLEYEDDEAHVVRSPGVQLADTGYYLSMRYSRKAKQLLQTMDIVHVHHPFLSGRLALRYCRPLHIPIVFTNHSRYDLLAQAYFPMMPEEVSHGMLQAYMPSFCDAVDVVIAPSPSIVNVLNNLKVRRNIEVVPNGVDILPFQSTKPIPRSEFGYLADDILIVYAGRVAVEKNLQFLVQSFAGVAEAIPNTYLLLIGGGQIQFDQEIKELVSKLDIENRVRFTGLIAYDKLPEYLAMCDIFVTASIAETFGMTTVEAMAAGLPLVAIQSPGASDIVEDGKTGFVATDHMAAYTAKLTRLCLDPQLRAQMSNSARKASAAYAIEHTTQLILKYYQQLVDDSHPRKSWPVRLRGYLERLLP